MPPNEDADDEVLLRSEEVQGVEMPVTTAPKRTSMTAVAQKPEKNSRDMLAPLHISANSLQQMYNNPGKSRETIALGKLESKMHRRKLK